MPAPISVHLQNMMIESNIIPPERRKTNCCFSDHLYLPETGKAADGEASCCRVRLEATNEPYAVPKRQRSNWQRILQPPVRTGLPLRRQPACAGHDNYPSNSHDPSIAVLP